MEYYVILIMVGIIVLIAITIVIMMCGERILKILCPCLKKKDEESEE